MTGTINPELLGLAWQNVERFAKDEPGHEKQAFMPAGDPAMMGGGDPAAAGGAPPMDPMAAGGAPPPGGAPPMDPAMAGGGAPPAPAGGGTSPEMLMQQVSQGVNAAAAGGGGKGGMKIDQNMVMLQMLKLLARIADASGVKVSASDMVVTPDDVTQMAQGGIGYAGVTPDGGQQGGDPAGGQSAIQPPSPIEPMGAATKTASEQGTAVDIDTSSFGTITDRATAIQAIRDRRRAG